MDEQVTTQPPTTADESPSAKSQSGCIPQVPPWVAVAGMILALLIAAVIIRQIARPLSDLVFGNDVDVPIPEGATLEREEEDVGSVSRTMLYSTDQDACQVAQFYVNQDGVQCFFAPFACREDGTINLDDASSGFRTVGTCGKTELDSVDGFSWDVIISGGYDAEQGPATRFLVSIYE